jgi:DNA (cytosine-5)-methyltransferase 1
MGLADDYRLPKRYTDAYHLLGDGVAPPVVRHLAQHIFEPLLEAAAKHGAAA